MNNIVVGLVPAPELPAKVIYKLRKQLEADLLEEISGFHWIVEVEVDRLTGSADTTNEIMNEAKRLKKNNNWNYTISFTDLPVFHEKCAVIADADIEERVAQISLPAFGMMPTTKRVRLTILHMVKELYYRNLQTEEGIETVVDGIGIKESKKQQSISSKIKGAFQFLKIRRVEFSKKQDGVSVRFLTKSTFGKFPLVLSGMTIANQPWTIMPSFKKVVGLAFATGSYMLVFTTLWQLSYLYDFIRFILLMCFAIGGMTAWVIFAHNLWERKSKKNSNGIRNIYNASTVLTLLAATIIFYISLFVLFLFAVTIFVPPDMFEEVIENDVNIINYLALAWLVTSVATVAGTIGAGLENEEVVRTSTYGYRQYIRSKKAEEKEEEDNKNEKSKE